MFLSPATSAIAGVISGQTRSNAISLLATYIANFTLIGNFNGHLGLPAVQTISRTSGNSLIVEGSDNFVNLDIDLDGIFSPVPRGFTFFRVCAGSLCASFNYNIIGINNLVSLTQEERFDLTTRPRVKR